MIDSVGIMSYEKFKEYTMAIAGGKHKPEKGEPKIWFESIETMKQLLPLAPDGLSEGFISQLESMMSEILDREKTDKLGGRIYGT